MRANLAVSRLIVTAVVAGIAGTVGGITFASASDTNTKTARVTGYQVVKEHNPATQPADRTVLCPRGKVAVSGGGEATPPSPSLSSFGRVVLSVPAGGPRRTGWRTAIVAGFPGQEQPMVEADIYAVCADA
jgi:hypothetical protein